MKYLIILSLFFVVSCSENSNIPLQNAQAEKSDPVLEKQESKVISDSTNILEKKVQQLELEYIAWGCACANWITTADRIKYQDSGLIKHCIFIEPDSTFDIGDNFQPGTQKIAVKGQFYIKEDYPRGTIKTEEDLEKAKVFRYTKIKVLSK